MLQEARLKEGPRCRKSGAGAGWSRHGRCCLERHESRHSQGSKTPAHPHLQDRRESAGHRRRLCCLVDRRHERQRACLPGRGGARSSHHLVDAKISTPVGRGGWVDDRRDADPYRKQRSVARHPCRGAKNLRAAASDGVRGRRGSGARRRQDRAPRARVSLSAGLNLLVDWDAAERIFAVMLVMNSA